jgi:hypothetical protein
MHDLLQQRLLAALEADTGVAARMAELENEVRAGIRTPTLAVAELLSLVGLGDKVQAAGTP